jgi:hypothetical protein
MKMQVQLFWIPVVQESFLSALPIPSLGLLVFFFIIENDHEVSCRLFTR